MLVLCEIYGCIESVLQCYKQYYETLSKNNFKINPYCICVANNIINGKQFIIVCFVDNNKLSHMEKEVNDEKVQDIKKHLVL